MVTLADQSRAVPLPPSEAAPATAGMEELLSFRVDERLYAVALRELKRVAPLVAFEPAIQAPETVLGTFVCAGEPVTACEVRQRLGHGPRPLCLTDRLLVLHGSSGAWAIAVQEVLGVVQSGPHSSASAAELGVVVPGLAAVTRQGAGLVPVLNLESLLTPAERAFIAAQGADR